MKILLNSRAFYPSVGGLEVMSYQLAEAWCDMGHDVRVWSTTPLGDASEVRKFKVERNPGFIDSVKMVVWADVIVQNGMSIRSGWPLLLGRPLVCVHQQNLLRPTDKTWFKKKSREWTVRFVNNVCISSEMIKELPPGAVVIPNAFRLGFEGSDLKARRGLVFAGRLVSDKGVDTAIKAVGKLVDGGYDARLVIYGDGPDRLELQALSDELNLGDRIRFAGLADAQTLQTAFRSAEVVIVPSRYEPFGIVALEAIAAGAPVVASDTGGLPDAVGACGLLVPPDNPAALASGVLSALNPERQEAFRLAAPPHLDRHRIERIAAEYLDVIQHAVATE